MLLFTLFIIFNLSKSFCIKSYRNFNFLKKDIIENQLNLLITTDNSKTVILNGCKTLLKKEYCKIFSDVNKLHFKEFLFNDFMKELPYNNNNQTLLYVSDFLIGNGRVLNSYEESKLLEIPKTSNIIILEADNIEKIPIKDPHLVYKFKILQFPKVTKRDIINYIYNTIEYNNYQDELYILNWNKYKNIENLNLEKLNILLFEIDSMMNDNVKFNYVHSQIDFLINSLLFL